MGKVEHVQAIRFSHIEPDQEPWIKIAQQIVANPHQKREDDWMKSCVIGLRSINDDSCREAVKIIKERLS